MLGGEEGAVVSSIGREGMFSNSTPVMFVVSLSGYIFSQNKIPTA